MSIRYLGAALTDAGNYRKNNQDSVCLKIVNTRRHGQIAMGVVCDGMGGLVKGELASAEVLRAFEDWFDRRLPERIDSYTWEGLAADWKELIAAQNGRLRAYGRERMLTLGTTLSAILLIEGKYMIAHVGDSRVYALMISPALKVPLKCSLRNMRPRSVAVDEGRQVRNVEVRLTEDHTLAAREVRRGSITEGQAGSDAGRHVLLQCVGASETVEPDILYGNVGDASAYLLCTDGFWHKLKEGELYEYLGKGDVGNTEEMEVQLRRLAELVKLRNEKDNISAALIVAV